MNIHKSQGQTVSTVVIDLGKAEKAAGCSFEALSRVRSLDNVVLQPLSFPRLQVIGKSKQLQQRLREEERLQNRLKLLHVNISTAINLHKRQPPIFHKCSLIFKSYIPTLNARYFFTCSGSDYEKSPASTISF